MYRFNLLLKYFYYYFTSSTKHQIHSPFVFELLTNVISTRKKFPEFKKINAVRTLLLNSNKEIVRKDKGAGSSVNSLQKKSVVKNIAKYSAISKKQGEWLFRLVKYFNASNIIELGTSLGISTLYQALANEKAKIISIEGCDETAQTAKENFEKLHIFNIELLNGDFQTQLPVALSQLNQLDFVFFDGNHQKEATLNYVHLCLPFIHNNSIFVFHDIRWSKKMEESWKEIKQHPLVTVTIDLFFMGLVFFRKEQAKEHFIIRF